MYGALQPTTLKAESARKEIGKMVYQYNLLNLKFHFLFKGSLHFKVPLSLWSLDTWRIWENLFPYFSLNPDYKRVRWKLYQVSKRTV